MPTFVIELTKTIIVAIEAETAEEAQNIATNNDDGFDGAWERAEPQAELLEGED